MCSRSATLIAGAEAVWALDQRMMPLLSTIAAWTMISLSTSLDCTSV